MIYTTGDVQIDNEAHTRTPARAPSEMLMSGLTISRAQELTIDVAERGTEVPIERLSTPALVAERWRLQGVLEAAPPIPSGVPRHEVDYTERNLTMMEQRVQELEQRKRPLRERLRGPDDELERAIDVLHGLRADKEKQHARQELRVQGFAERKRYLADHDGDRQKIERIDALLGDRAQSAVANAMIETPEYMRDLIGGYRSAKHKGRWIDAATKVEDYRHHHAITDLRSAFGAEPTGAERHAWQHAHDGVIAALEPQAKTRGLRMR